MSSKAQVYASFVIYVRNQAGTIPEFIARMRTFAHDGFEQVEFIFVDDASLDGSAEVLARCSVEQGIHATILRLAHWHDKERAIFAGTDRAIGDYNFEFEGPWIDYPLDLLSEMFERSRMGDDVVVLSPDRARGLFRRGFYRIFNSFSHIEAVIGEHRVMILTRRALNSLLSINERKRYRKVLIWLTGLKVRTITFAPSNAGFTDSRTFGERFNLAIDYLVSYSSIGSLVPLAISGFFVLFSLGIIVYAVISYFVNSHLASGWTSLMLFLSISFSGLFLVLGILCEYVAKLLHESTNLPMYSISSVEHLRPQTLPAPVPKTAGDGTGGRPGPAAAP